MSFSRVASRRIHSSMSGNFTSRGAEDAFFADRRASETPEGYLRGAGSSASISFSTSCSHSLKYSAHLFRYILDALDKISSRLFWFGSPTASWVFIAEHNCQVIHSHRPERFVVIDRPDLFNFANSDSANNRIENLYAHCA
jgi:hypothetical protein